MQMQSLTVNWPLVSVTWDMIHHILDVVKIHSINLVGNNLTSSREICWIEKGEDDV